MTASCVKVSTCKMLGTVAGLHTYLFNLHHNIDPGGLMQCPPDQNLNLNVTTCLMHMLHFLWCTLCISLHNLLFSFNLLPGISNYSITPNHTVNTAHNALHHTLDILRRPFYFPLWTSQGCSQWPTFTFTSPKFQGTMSTLKFLPGLSQIKFMNLDHRHADFIHLWCGIIVT